MQVAVTGGSGQLGSQITERLLAHPQVSRVVVIDVRPPRLQNPKLQFVKKDVRDPSLADDFAGLDAVFHLAFVVTKYLPRAEMESINLGGSRNVFGCVLRARVPQLLYASSVAAYGVVPGHPEPLLEDAPRQRQVDFPYACTKYDVEAILDGIEREHPMLKIVRMRPVILLGSHMDHGLGTALAARRMIDGGDVPMPIVSDEDVADAFMLAMDKRAHGAFNLAAEEFLTPSEIAQRCGLKLIRSSARVRRALGTAFKVAAAIGLTPPAEPSWLTSGGVRMMSSAAKARRELGWQPRYPTAEAVVQRALSLIPPLDLAASVKARFAQLVS